MTVDLARLYDQHTIIAGFEQSPEEHCIKKMRKMAGANITCPSWMDDDGNDEFMKEHFNFIMDHYSYIDVTKTGGNIIEILKAAAERTQELREQGKTVRHLVIDPFNMLSIKSRLNGTERIEEILRKITQFSHQMKMMVILIAHPFKMKIDEKTGDYIIPDFYSVKGSSAFFEMSYHGMVVYRKRRSSEMMVRMLKVKQNNMGKKDSEAFFEYDVPSGRYIPMDEEGNELQGDHRQKNW